MGPAKGAGIQGHRQNLHLECSSAWGGGCFVPTLLSCTQTLCGDCITLEISPQAFLV